MRPTSTTHEAALPRQRIEGLDGLRAIAVTIVVLLHGGVLPWGWVGVDLFFCLSGFLITGILLDSKDGMASTRHILVAFYIRRSLRIFPLALLAVLVMAIATGAGWSAAWYATYVVNWFPYHLPAPRDLAHYWSLAVEEQYYLLWPLLVLRLSPRSVMRAAFLLVAGGIVTRAALVHFDPPFATTYFLHSATIIRADGLLIGSILAVMLRMARTDTLKDYAWHAGRLMVYSMLVAATFEWLLGVNPGGHAVEVAFALSQTALALGFGCLLFLVAFHPPRWIRNRWLVGIGTISYGIYVIHGCLMYWLRPVRDAGLRTALLFVLSVALAYASWRCFESPLLALKRRWPMPAIRSPGRLASAASHESSTRETAIASSR